MLSSLLAFGLVVAPVPPAPLSQLAGVYDCVHPDWKDTVTLAADGTYQRGSGDPGKWTFDGKQIVLGWKNWGPESLQYEVPGVFADASKGFRCKLRNPPSYEGIPGTYDGKHHDWHDSVTLKADGSYQRGNGDPGRWVYDGKTLVLRWFNWGAAPLVEKTAGRVFDDGKGFSLVKRDAPAPVVPQPAVTKQKHIETNKLTYKVGEPIVVRYFAMKQTGTDFTNIVPVGTANNEWGDWEYTNGEASGQRTFKKNLAPGEYEARAYFDSSMDVKDRIVFKVVP